MERVYGRRIHHSPPTQEVPWAEKEVVQRQNIGEAIDEQYYNPYGGDYDQSTPLGKDLLLKASPLDARITIEGRQSHEIDRHLR